MNFPRPFAYFLFSLPWLIAAASFFWFAALRYPASGIFTVETKLDGKSAWVNPFLPAERVSSPGKQPDGWTGQRVLDDPTYFTARTPGPYDSMDVTLEYRPVRQPLLEFGLVHDPEGKNLELKPLFSEQLETVDWRYAKRGAVSGFVRSSISPDRLVDLNPTGLAIWGASATTPLLTDQDGPEISTPVSLRGSHDFYFVPTAGSLNVTFTLQAANRKQGSDIAAFRVFRADEEIQREAFGASGSLDSRMAKTAEHRVILRKADPGVYRISFIAQDDVFIRVVKTKALRWVIGPRVYFGDVVGYSTSTFPGQALTNSRHIVAETFHIEGLQTLTLNDRAVQIKKTHTAFRLDRTDDTAASVRLFAPRGDVKIVGDGYFALRDDSFFEPKPRRLTDATDVNKEHIDAVVTSYSKPERLEDGWYRSTFKFSINPSLDKLRFVLSAPGLASRAAAVDVRRIRLTYRRPAVTWDDWWRTLRQELANAWRRL